MTVKRLGFKENVDLALAKALAGETVRLNRVADIEVFDGEPRYESSNGIVIPRSEVLHAPFSDLTKFGRVIDNPWGRDRLEESGLANAHRNLMLRPLNRKHHERVHNQITTLGLNLVADLLVLATSDPAPTMPGGMKLGTSSTAASLGDVDIIGDMSDASATDFQGFESGYPSDGGTTVQWRSFWDAGEATNATINEVVIKSADGSSDAISRIVFTTINKGASDTLQITVTWTLSAA